MPEQPRPRLGGTDGYRATATLQTGAGLMNEETVAGLTYALVDMQRVEGETPLVVIGYDPRPSGPRLERAAVAGAVAAGAEVIRMGQTPTPTTFKTALLMGAHASVEVSASHCKPEINGWKGALGSHKPFGPQVDEISDRYWANTDSGLTIPLDLADKVPQRPEFTEAYINMVVADMEQEFGERPLEGKVFVVDAANGAAMNVTPKVMEKLGATVHTYACDGERPINEGSGATDLEGVKGFMRRNPEIVKNPNFVGALTHDGDADRYIGVGARIRRNGEMEFSDLEGNRVMELRAKGQPGTVGTEYTNDASVNRLRRGNIFRRGKVPFEFCSNGDVNVTNALRGHANDSTPWTRGSEYTGHHVDLEWLSSGDGVRTGVWTACYAAQKGTTFAEICKKLPLWHQAEFKIVLAKHISGVILDHPRVAEGRQAASTELEQASGRHVTRTSGTEEGVVRVWASSKNRKTTDRVAGELVSLITLYGQAPQRGPIDSRVRSI